MIRSRQDLYTVVVEVAAVVVVVVVVVVMVVVVVVSRLVGEASKAWFVCAELCRE